MRILILDTNTDYSQRFKHYLGKRYPNLQISACDNIEAVRKQFQEEVFDVVLFDVSFEKVNSESLGLLNSGAAFAYVSETDELVNGQETIFKYYSVSELYAAVCTIYEHKKKRVIKTENTVEQVDRKTDVITFLPAHGGAGSSTMAVACAVALSSESKVLYINLEQRPSDSVFFEGDKKKSLTDIVSTMKTKYNPEGIKNVLEQVVQKDKRQRRENLYYIKGYNNIMDCLSMQAQQIEFVLKILRENFDYRYIVIDTDFIVSDILQKLTCLSNKIVFTSSGSDTSNIKLLKIQRYLDILKRDEDNTIPDSYLIFNQYYGLNDEKAVVRDMNVIARFARYRTNDKSRITSQKVIEEVLSKPQVFDKLK